MELSELIPHIEALIFASDKPLSGADITDLINGAFGFMEDKITPEQVDTALEGIVEKYDSEFYPFTIRQSGGGWQFLTKKEYHKTVAQLNGEKYLKRLSAAALETLAIIAYKQPITKGEIEQIRGVSADYTIQKLLEKELIIIAGRNENAPGHPLVYATSRSFMDYFGLNNPSELPRIKEVLQDAVQPTLVMSAEEVVGSSLIVSDNGELIDRSEDEPGARLFINDEAGEVSEGNGEASVEDSETLHSTAAADEAIELTPGAIGEEGDSEEADADPETEEGS